MANNSAVGAVSGGDNDSWVVSIEQALAQELRKIAHDGSEERRRAPGRAKCTIFRIPWRVKDSLGANDTTYNHGADGVALGLYHRPGRYVAPKLGEAFKIKMASAYLTTLFMNEDSRQARLARLGVNNPAIKEQLVDREDNSWRLDNDVESSISAIRDDELLRDQVWRDLCNEIVGGDSGLELTKQRYLLEGDDQVADSESKEVLKCALALDSITVATALCVFYLDKGNEIFPFDLFHEHLERNIQVGKKSSSAVFKFHLDFIKLENQVPLPLLRRALRILHNEPVDQIVEESKGDAALNFVCAQLARDLSNKFLPGCDEQLTKDFMDCVTEKIMFLDCDHPLDCISHVWSPESREIIEDLQISEESQSSKGKQPNWIPRYIDPFRGRHLGQYTEEQCRSHLHGRMWTGISSFLRYFFGSHSKSTASGNGRSQHFKVSILSGESRRNVEGQASWESSRSFGGWRLSWASRRLQSSLFRSRNEDSNTEPRKSRNFSVPCAAQLHEAGIDFRNRANIQNCDLLPVFVPGWIKATLYIPRLPRLTSLTLVVWKNLVAYESRAVHSGKQSESQFLALLGFLNNLIDTREDVLLMTLGRDPVLPDRHSTPPEDVAKTLNTILKGFPVPEYQRWLALKKKIVDYHNQKWRRMILDFLRTNFGKPWLVISVFAATILLVLQVLQTVYTVLPYYPS